MTAGPAVGAPAVVATGTAQGRASRRLTPAMATMVAWMCTIVDETVVYDVALEAGERAETVRRQLLRAARIAGVEIAIRRSPNGYFVGLMTDARRPEQRPGARSAGASADDPRD